MRYANERGLPAVALCVSNTYGPRDWQPTPHGKQLALAAVGKLPFYVKGWTGEAVGVEDAAAALLLAAEKGRTGAGLAANPGTRVRPQGHEILSGEPARQPITTRAVKNR